MLLMYFFSHMDLILVVCIQEKGSVDIVLKAMGRAINKTVMITELIKVIEPAFVCFVY